MTVRKPAKQSSETNGCEMTRFNALRHGVLSRYTVLPWEDLAEYKDLLEALVKEHFPQGPTEEHLVEEIAGIIWRKRRLRLAECASFRRSLSKVTSPDGTTVRAALIHLDVEKKATIDTDEVAALHEDQVVINRAIETLKSDKAHAYDKALGTLHDGMQKRWATLSKARELELLPFDTIGPAYTTDAHGLLQFLENEVDELESRQTELESPELVRDQSLGEALSPDLMDGLVRYEVHLDRKLERMVSMLIRLKELRTIRPGC
jgi:hypothetical protein